VRIRGNPKLGFRTCRNLILLITAYQHPVSPIATDLYAYHSLIIGSDPTLPYRNPAKHS
jgi:hypothetical protein